MMAARSILVVGACSPRFLDRHVLCPTWASRTAMRGRSRLFALPKCEGAVLGVSCSDPAAPDHAPALQRAEPVLSALDASTADDHCRYLRHRDRKIWGCSYDLPIGPRGSGDSPSDWGICGITKVIGNSDGRQRAAHRRRPRQPLPALARCGKSYRAPARRSGELRKNSRIFRLAVRDQGKRHA